MSSGQVGSDSLPNSLPENLGAVSELLSTCSESLSGAAQHGQWTPVTQQFRVAITSQSPELQCLGILIHSTPTCLLHPQWEMGSDLSEGCREVVYIRADREPD